MAVAMERDEHEILGLEVPRMPILPLAAEQLRWRVPEGVLEFRTTAEIHPVETIIGQPNAYAALRRGVLLESPGFNVFVVGLLSTGRLGTVKRILDELRPKRRATRDLCYVSNFKEPGRPRLMEFPPGRGVAFRKELLRVAAALVEEVPRLLRSDEVRTQRDRRTQDAEVTHHGALQRLEAHAREWGFLIGDLGEEGRPSPVILWMDPTAGALAPEAEADAPVHTRAELQVLADAGAIELPISREEIFHRFDELERELAAAMNLSREAVMDTVRKVAETEREAIGAGTRKVLADLGRRWPSARPWLHELHDELVESPEWFDDEGDREALFSAFTVNVVHRGSRSPHAPVVVVPNATWQHLFGGIEGEPGGVDHRSIHGGSLLDADGGFLVLNAADLLQEPGSWRLLKRALMFGQVDIQNPESPLGASAAVLRPDPMRLDVKVVLLGDADTHAALFYGDADFASIFKIKAEFEEDAACTPEILREYAGFVARMVRRERLTHFTKDAVAAVLEWAVRDGGRGGRISTHFGSISDLLREAAFEAGAGLVDRNHIEAALLARRTRDDLAERRVLEMMESGVLRVDLEGRRVGQVNALVVYHVGGHDFGRPIRITAAVGVGRGGVVSIEREARLSGRMHQKGVQILRGLMLGRFGRDGPLCFSASLCFEQSYARVDGDSASTAEVYALMSALSDLPLRQDIAATGSVNQFGEVQGVGGVNEKIEGFFAACQVRGLTGTQGVLIPTHNVADLCLSPQVQSACVEGRFHVWAVSSIEEGLELLTGTAAGHRDATGGYPEGTVLGRVEAELARYAEISRPRRR
jgi:ATP-dependent Lon protease